MVGLKKKTRSHTQKSHPKVVNPRDIAGERTKKNKQNKTKQNKKKKKTSDNTGDSNLQLHLWADGREVTTSPPGPLALFTQALAHLDHTWCVSGPPCLSVEVTSLKWISKTPPLWHGLAALCCVTSLSWNRQPTAIIMSWTHRPVWRDVVTLKQPTTSNNHAMDSPRGARTAAQIPLSAIS